MQCLYFIFLNGLHISPQEEWKLNKKTWIQFILQDFLQKFLEPELHNGQGNESRTLYVNIQRLKCLDKTHPNFKVDVFLCHLQMIFNYTCMPCCGISQVMSKLWDSRVTMPTCLGLHIKRRHWFSGCLHYWWMVHFCLLLPQPASPQEVYWHWIFTLHTRCMSLFDCLMDAYHQVKFDNL